MYLKHYRRNVSFAHLPARQVRDHWMSRHSLHVFITTECQLIFYTTLSVLGVTLFSESPYHCGMPIHCLHFFITIGCHVIFIHVFILRFFTRGSVSHNIVQVISKATNSLDYLHVLPIFCLVIPTSSFQTSATGWECLRMGSSNIIDEFRFLPCLQLWDPLSHFMKAVIGFLLTYTLEVCPFVLIVRIPNFLYQQSCHLFSSNIVNTTIGCY